jgi:fatty acid desaturase
MAAASTNAPASTDYARLKRRVSAAGLLAPQPRYYILKSLASLALFSGAVAAVLLAGTVWQSILAAFALGFVFTQVGLLAHDVAHMQVFRRRRPATTAALIAGNLAIGFSYSWWREKHNMHHGNPNHVSRDPDCEIPVLVLAQGQRHSRSRLVKRVVQWQVFYFWLLLPFQAVGMRLHSWHRVSMLRNRLGALEGAALVANLALYIALLAFAGPWWIALLVLAVHNGTFGLYNSLVFAPNHKGMLNLTDGTRLDFLHEQVLTARNIKGHPLTDFLYGGLNYQIEHHLFPTMARNRLSDAQPIVKQFCAEHGIAYHEANFWTATAQVASFLRDAPHTAPIEDPVPAVAPAPSG